MFNKKEKKCNRDNDESVWVDILAEVADMIIFVVLDILDLID